MKNFIILIGLLFAAKFDSAQKYILIDKTMVAPPLYTNDVSFENTGKNIFVVETHHLKEFVAALDKISSRFTYGRKENEDFNTNIGNTKITSTPIMIRKEERLDIVLNTHIENISVSMHLSDTRISNSQNLFFISSWLKYIRSNTK